MSSVASAFESLEERIHGEERRDVDGVSGLMQASLNATMERGIKTMCLEFGVSVLLAVAEEYEMDAKEMAERIGMDNIEVKRVTARKAKTTGKAKGAGSSASKWEKPQVMMPWTGERYTNPDTCQAIRPYSKLYSQCVNKSLSDSIYCKTCHAHAKKSEEAGGDFKPNAGNVTDREEQGLCEKYTLPSGKTETVAHYGNVVEKASKDEKKGELYEKAVILAEAEKFGLTIPEEMLEPKAKKRPGRPKKSDTEDSDEDESLVSKAKKATEKAKAETEKATKKAKFDAKSVGYDEDDAELDEILEEATEEPIEKAEKPKKVTKKAEKTEKVEDSDVEEVEEVDSDTSSKSKSSKSSKSKKSSKSSKKFSIGGYDCKKHKDGHITAKVDGSEMTLEEFVFEDGRLVTKKGKKKVSTSDFTKAINKRKIEESDDSSDDDSDDENEE